MKNGLVAIIQKELRRFFTDYRMVFTTIFLPGLMIFALYSLMGNVMANNLTVGDDYEAQVYAVNLPDSLASAGGVAELNVAALDASEIESVKERIAAKEADLLMVFPADFDARVAEASQGGDAASGGRDTPPAVELYYNSTRVESSAMYGQAQQLLSAYKEALMPLFSVNAAEGAGAEDSYDLASEQDATGFMFASLLPMLLMVFLFSGCMAVAPESIAGEKERGTIATLLVTPLKRWELALGKLIALCIVSVLAGASSFIGMLLSLPSLLNMGGQGAGGQGATLESATLYGAGDYLMILAVIISTVMLFVGAMSLISAYARTIKEASTMVLPLMIVVMLVGVMGMFQTSSETNLLFYLIPAYNSVQSLASVFSFSVEPLALMLTVGVNLLVTAGCCVVLTRMFNSERIVFGK